MQDQPTGVLIQSKMFRLLEEEAIMKFILNYEIYLIHLYITRVITIT